MKMLRAFRGSRVCRVDWFHGFRIPAMWASLGPGITSPTHTNSFVTLTTGHPKISISILSTADSTGLLREG